MNNYDTFQEARSKEYLASLPPIVKQLYEEDPEVANMSALEVAEFRYISNKTRILICQ